MHVKPPLILHFLISQRTKKWGDGRAVVLGVSFFVVFFGLHLHETNNILLIGD